MSAEERGYPASTTLDVARVDANLSVGALWLQYFALGGNVVGDDFDALLAGSIDVSRSDHNMVAAALNEVFTARGQDSPVPYR